MIQSRYFFSFILSTLIFFLLYLIIISLINVEKVLRPAPSKVIKIAIVTAPKKVAKPVIKPIITPKPIKKIEKKKIVKKKIIKKKIHKKKKPKKVIKKKIIKKVKHKKIVKKKIVRKKIVRKKVIAKKIIKKPIKKEPVVTYTPTPSYIAPKTISKPKAKSTPAAKNNYYKKAFLRNVRAKIITNKRYPRIAKRRHIEGAVKVRFDITKYGQVKNIRFINGKSIFHKSIRKTLERTFPMGIPNEVKNELPILNVSVILHFNIR